jgi:hypothetical protein
MASFAAVLLVLALGLALLVVGRSYCLLGGMATSFHLGYVSAPRLVAGARFERHLTSPLSCFPFRLQQAEGCEGVLSRPA